MKKTLLSFLMIAAAVCILTAGCEESTEYSIDIQQESLVLEQGQSAKLNITSNAPDILWSSSAPETAEVDQDGNVTAKTSGQAVIRACIADDASLYDECSVTVNAPAPKSLFLHIDSLDLRPGETFSLELTVYPEDPAYVLSWHSDNTDVAEVAQDGTVTATGPGETLITVTAGTKADTCIVEVMTAAVGDWYYQDGTWSSYLYPEKTPIGIVFWTGDPTSNDPTLKKEHPDCTHGLVAAINDAGASSWQSKYYLYKQTVSSWTEANIHECLSILSNTDGVEPDYLNKVLGYNNTKAIEQFNSAPENTKWKVEAVTSLQEYREKNQAPQSSSGWYLPSAKELSLMCSGEVDYNIWNIATYLLERKEYLNTRLQSISGASLFTSTSYWSSTEISAEHTAYVAFSMGTVMDFNKDSDMLNIRPVLAF